MRRVTLLLAMVLAFFTLTVSAASAVTTSHATHTQVTCSQSYTAIVGPPNPGNASVVWRSNPCGHQIRVKITCSGSSFPATVYGGWVRTVGLHSGATCPGADPNLAAAYAQYRNSPSGVITTVRFF
jgi:hypothetical protein